jgi:flagellar biosynthesis protein FliQ
MRWKRQCRDVRFAVSGSTSTAAGNGIVNARLVNAHVMNAHVMNAHVMNAHVMNAQVMNEGDVLEVVRSGMYTTLIVAGPALAGALLTGVAISILQALTQVQEMTLANIPKIFMTLLLVMLFLPLSFAAMRSYMDQIMQMVVRI